MSEGRAESLSAWVNGALAERVAKERHLLALGEAVAAYEQRFGAISAQELADQARADRESAVVVRGRKPKPAKGNWPRRPDVTVVLDSGALIALEKNDRAMWRRLKASLLAGSVPISHGGIVGQAWRGGGPRQALLARALDGIDIRALDRTLGRAAGELLARAGSADVIDAALVLIADDGDDIVTSDPDDLEPLAALLGRHVELLHA